MFISFLCVTLLISAGDHSYFLPPTHQQELGMHLPLKLKVAVCWSDLVLAWRAIC